MTALTAAEISDSAWASFEAVGVLELRPDYRVCPYAVPHLMPRRPHRFHPAARPPAPAPPANDNDGPSMSPPQQRWTTDAAWPGPPAWRAGNTGITGPAHPSHPATGPAPTARTAKPLAGANELCRGSSFYPYISQRTQGNTTYAT